MRYRTFALYNVAGGIVWAGGSVLLGYLAGAGWRKVDHALSLAPASRCSASSRWWGSQWSCATAPGCGPRQARTPAAGSGVSRRQRLTTRPPTAGDEPVGA